MSRKAVVDMGMSANLGDGRGRFSLFTGANDPFNGLFRKPIRAQAETGHFQGTMPPIMRMRRRVEGGLPVHEGLGGRQGRLEFFAMQSKYLEIQKKERDKKFKRVGNLIAKQLSDRMSNSLTIQHMFLHMVHLSFHHYMLLLQCSDGRKGAPYAETYAEL